MPGAPIPLRRGRKVAAAVVIALVVGPGALVRVFLATVVFGHFGDVDGVLKGLCD